MSQDRTLSRRAALTGAAALPLAGALAAIPISGATAEVDPIYAAIERHRRAARKLSRLIKIEHKLPYKEPIAGVCGDLTEPCTLTVGGKTTEIPAEPFYLRTLEEIDRHINDEVRKLSGKGRDAYVAGQGALIERKALMHEELNRQEEAATTPEMEAARSATMEAMEAEYETMQLFIATVPTTAQGLSAMLAYLLKPAVRETLEDEDIRILLETLANAARPLAGLRHTPHRAEAVQS